MPRGFEERTDRVAEDGAAAVRDEERAGRVRAHESSRLIRLRPRCALGAAAVRVPPAASTSASASWNAAGRRRQVHEAGTGDVRAGDHLAPSSARTSASAISARRPSPAFLLSTSATLVARSPCSARFGRSTGEAHAAQELGRGERPTARGGWRTERDRQGSSFLFSRYRPRGDDPANFQGVSTQDRTKLRRLPAGLLELLRGGRSPPRYRPRCRSGHSAWRRPAPRSRASGSPWRARASAVAADVPEGAGVEAAAERLERGDDLHRAHLRRAQVTLPQGIIARTTSSSVTCAARGARRWWRDAAPHTVRSRHDARGAPGPARSPLRRLRPRSLRCRSMAMVSSARSFGLGVVSSPASAASACASRPRGRGVPLMGERSVCACARRALRARARGSRRTRCNEPKSA